MYHGCDYATGICQSLRFHILFNSCHLKRQNPQYQVFFLLVKTRFDLLAWIG